MMKLDVRACDLKLVRPFRVAGFTLTDAQTLVARVEWDGRVGYGESAPLARYGDSVPSMLDFYAGFTLPEHATPFSAARILDGIPRAARCALDIALYDLLGNVLGASITQLLGLEGLDRPPTSLTIPIEEDLEAVLARVRELGDVPALKIKVGGMGFDDIALIEAVRAEYTGAIRLDANEGWSAERAVAILRELERFEIEFCEQPIPAGHPEQLRWIGERTAIPIMADEDAVVASQLGPLFGCVPAVNVKLAKCGGLGAAYDMIAAARALGMKVMIGCMAESTVLTTAAAHLGPLTDWLDIDGPTWIANDPFTGVTYENGRLIMPQGSGLGIAPVPGFA
jgi:L-alanine-DL-glutamate epimerase-like enolase superfamily enzyme